MRHIANPQADEVTASEFAVDRKVKHGEVSHLVSVLQVDADSPDVFRLERRLLANQLPLFQASRYSRFSMTDSLLLIGA